MFSEPVLDHFQNPRNPGELPPPAISAEVSNPVCGDVLKLSARVEGGRLREVRFQARGCVATIACGSVLTELSSGKTVEEARNLSASDVSQALGGLPAASGHASILAEDALKSVLQKVPRESC
jgi:nitrogen fixation NifU-like protein